MDNAIPHVRIVENVTADTFRDEVAAGAVPVVLKGVVADWPAVQEGLTSPQAAADYVKRFDQGNAVDTLLGSPEIGGRFFYNDDLTGLNFAVLPEQIGLTIDRILGAIGEKNPPSFYIQSMPIADILPGFEKENALDIVAAEESANIWIGNRLTVQTHFDLRENLACCVSGRRRVTLFPPTQTPNLYPGPFELTLSGPPVSMVMLDDPNFDTYPRFREALEHAVVADLEAGDALYIPYFWWHHVQALEDLNILVTYFWNDAPKHLGSPFDALLGALLAIRDMPEHQREAWRAMFDYYIFRTHGDPVAHLPAVTHGPLGEHNDETRRRIRVIVMNSLARLAGVAKQDSG